MFFMRGSDSSVLSRLLHALKAVQQHAASARKAYSSMRSFTTVVLKQQISSVLLVARNVSIYLQLWFCVRGCHVEG